jgi:hypothetical protein
VGNVCNAGPVVLTDVTVKDAGLLGYNAVKFGRNATKFRRNLSPLSSRSKCKSSRKPSEAGGEFSLLGLFFHPEDRDDMFLRNFDY